MGKKNNRGLLGSLAFWSVLVVGLCMLVSGILGIVGVASRTVSILRSVAMAAAFFVLILLSFRGARGRGMKWFALYIIAVVMIVGGYFLSLKGVFNFW